MANSEAVTTEILYGEAAFHAYPCEPEAGATGAASGPASPPFCRLVPEAHAHTQKLHAIVQTADPSCGPPQHEHVRRNPRD